MTSSRAEQGRVAPTLVGARTRVLRPWAARVHAQPRAVRRRARVGRAGCKMRCRIRPTFPRPEAKSQVAAAAPGPHSVRPHPYLSRTHVPHADDPPIEQALAPRAGARCHGNGTRVRDAGRGIARPCGSHGTGSPAGARGLRRAGRPHRRPPAPPAPHPSAPHGPDRNGPAACPGLPYAGPSPGTQAGLTRRRRPVWEDGSAERPGALPGAPDFTASRAAPHGAARVQ
jgi:hypothetical protein